MNSGDDSPAELKDGWPVGHPAGHGFDLALQQDMRRRVVEGKLDNVHAIIVVRDGVLGSVEIHREFISAAARRMFAAKL